MITRNRYRHHSPIEYANLGIRLLAMLFDALLLLFFIGLIQFIGPQLPIETGISTQPWRNPAALALLFLAAMIITSLCWYRFAGTPGKLLAGVRVISVADGAAPGLGQSALRFLSYILSLLPAALGFLWCLWDQRHQSLHDKLSGTAVIHDDEASKSLAQLLEELP